MKKITLVDANNWFRRYMYSDKFLDIASMIVDLAGLNPTYLVWDGYNGNAKRREIYPDYKKSRKEKDMDTDFETLNMIRNDLIPYLPACSVSADGFEGELADCPEGDLQWVSREFVNQLPTWEGDKIFLDLLWQDAPFFLLKLRYEGEKLAEAVLNGKKIR